MNTAIITNQMFILGSTGSPPYCLVPPVRSADVGNAFPQFSARIMPKRLKGVKTQAANGMQRTVCSGLSEAVSHCTGGAHFRYDFYTPWHRLTVVGDYP